MSNLTKIVPGADCVMSGGDDALLDKLTQLFHDKLNLEIDSVDQDLIEEGLLDSLSLVEMLLLLEQEFGVEVSILDIDFEQFHTTRNLAAFVSTAMSASGPVAGEGILAVG